LMQRQLGGLDGRRVWQGAVQATLATGIMSLGVWTWLTGTAGRPAWQALGGGLLVGASVYGLVVWLLGVREVKSLANLIKAKVRTSS
jgi:hypothetical protein